MAHNLHMSTVIYVVECRVYCIMAGCRADGAHGQAYSLQVLWVAESKAAHDMECLNGETFLVVDAEKESLLHTQ